MTRAAGVRAPYRPPVNTTGSGTPPSGLARTVGCLFLRTLWIHIGIVAVGIELYRSFADDALPVVRDAWSDVCWRCSWSAWRAKPDAGFDTPGWTAGLRRADREAPKLGAAIPCTRLR